MTGRSLPEWIGSTADAKIPVRVQARLFLAAGGRCQNCSRKCGLGGERWEADHIKSLINGGENRETNLQILCRECHRQKTKGDVAEKALVYRKQVWAIGAKKKRSKFACAKTSKWKKKLDGTVVPRDD